MAMLPVQAPSEEGPVTTLRPRRPAGMHRGLASRSDERLVAIAKDGDERAFEILYERHSPAILRYCRSLLRSAQEAEDVKQEVFVLAISALRRGAEPDAFRPWLYRVAHNACMSHLRVRRPVLVADNGVLVGPAGAAAPVDTHREELRQLLDDIGTLPDVQRGALLLREMDGFSYEQVGEVLGLPLSTVRASIFRARRTLQGLADARDADCEDIQAELSRLADRRGRRGRHITTHLHVCANCREFRDGLRRRPSVLGGITPAGPFGGLLVALKGKLLGGAATGGGAGAALVTGGGGAGVAKIAAVAASSIALLAGAGVEADHVIEHGRRDAAATPRHVSAAPAPAAEAARGRAATATTAGAAVTPAITGTDRPRLEGRVVVVRTPRSTSRGAGGARRPHPRETARDDTPASGAHGSANATTPGTGAAPTSSSGAGERHHGGPSGSEGHDGGRGEDHSGARHSDGASEHASGGDDDTGRSHGRERTAPADGSAPGPDSGSGGGSNGATKPTDDTSHALTPSGGDSGTPTPAPATAPAPQTGTAPSGSSGSGSDSGSTPAPTAPSDSGADSAPADPTVVGSTVDPAPAPADPAPAAPVSGAGAA